MKPIKLFRNARLMDGTGRPEIEDACLLAEDERITYVGSAAGRTISMTCSGTGYFDGMYRVADGAEECRKAAREQLR